MRKLDLILENIRDEYMINLLEEGSVTELETLKTKKFLNENLSRIRKMLIEEGAMDGVKQHLGDNWGKYLTGIGGAVGANELMDTSYGEGMTDIIASDASMQDKLAAVKEYTGGSLQNAGTGLSSPQPEIEGPDNFEKYSEKEAEMLKYLQKDLPSESLKNMKGEIMSHSEPGWFSANPKISQGYNQGDLNSKVGDLFQRDVSGMTRADISNYVDSLYDNVQGKNNPAMDYGDEKEGIVSGVKDFFGKAEGEGKFNDTYMKNMDSNKDDAVNKIIAMRDDLKRYK